MSAVQQVLFGIGVSGPPPTPWSARSIKVVVSGYAGHALRVRRSNDNAEQDIDYVGSSINSALDTTALATFVGANSAFVVTWYDQSGNGNNWTQTTQASQPRIVNAGTYDGQVVYDGSNDRLISPNSGSSAVGLTVFAEWELRTSAATDLTHISRGIVDSSHDFWEWQRNTNNSSGFGIYPCRIVGGTSTNNYQLFVWPTLREPAGGHIQSARWDWTKTNVTGRATLWIDGASITSNGSDTVGTAPNTSTTFPAQTWTEGARGGGAQPSPINVKTMVIYETALSDALMLSISTALA